jgi:hypothetical protein
LDSIKTIDAIWRSVRPSEGLLWLSVLSVPWWVAGGWALDLYVGNQSRPHKDFDVGILRRDVHEVIAGLPSWDFFEAEAGVLTKLETGELLRAGVNPNRGMHGVRCSARSAECSN